MRAVAYPRVSSAQQRERQSIDSQLRELPAIAARNGWTLVKPVEHYIDDGRTAKAGKLSKRTGLKRLLADAAAGEFDVVIMADMDRLTRAEDLAERGMLLGALQHAGVLVATDGQVLDLNTDQGDIMATFMTWRAAAENRRKAKAIRDGKLTSAIRGGKPTGPDPFGHWFDKNTKTWLVDHQRAPFVVEIFERLAKGESCISIACDFARRNVPCSGRQWNKALVRYIARSTRPIGEYLAHRKSRTIVKVPPLVSVELWQQAQDALTKNHTNGLRRTKNVYLLEGLGVCGLCGSKMRIRSRVVQLGKYVRPAAYVCDRRLPQLPIAMRDPNAPKCTGQMLVEIADAAAWGRICEKLRDPELLEEIAGEHRDIAADQSVYESDVDGYTKHLARLDKVDEVIWARFRRADIDEVALDRELAKTRRERAAVSGQLKHAKRARGAAIGAQTRIGEASAMMKKLLAEAAAATPEERRELALAMIDPGGAAFYPSEIRIELVFERAGLTVRGSTRSMAVAGLLSDDHERQVRIQVVARVSAA